MSIKSYAARIGVKYGTLKRWIYESMPGTVRGSNGKVTAIDPEVADPWILTKRASRSWAFNRACAVYFLRCEATGEIKIGFSQDVAARILEIERKERRRTTLLATLPGDKTTELAMHATFAALRIGESEWFYPGVDLLEMIDLLARRVA
jgi:hypothetical protein